MAELITCESQSPPRIHRCKIRLGNAICILLVASLLIINPFLSVVCSIVLCGTRFSRVIYSTPYLLVTAVSVGVVVSTRTIPAYPADDLTAYWQYYLQTKTLSFYEIIIEYRFEPVLYWLYKYLFLGLEDPRQLLVFNSVLVSVAVISVAKVMQLRYRLPPWTIALVLAAFPYEIVSNIPRQMLATHIMLLAFYGGWRMGVLLVPIAVFTHKSTLLIACFRMLPFRNRFWFPLLTGAILAGFVGMAVVEIFIGLGLGSRIVSFFYREAASAIFIYLLFAVLVSAFIVSPNIRRDYMVYIYIVCTAVMLRDQGPLGIRIAYNVYIPSLIALTILLFRFKFRFKGILLPIMLGVMFLLRMTLLSVHGTHDPFSGVTVSTAWFYLANLM